VRHAPPGRVIGPRVAVWARVGIQARHQPDSPNPAGLSHRSDVRGAKAVRA